MADEVTNASEFIPAKSILAWVSYPPGFGSTSCFAYPAWMSKGTEVVPIAASAVPDRGCICVSIQGGDTAGVVREKYGDVVVASINANSIENHYYGDTSDDRYFALFNDKFLHSQIEFSRLESSSFGRDLLQIVELDEEGVSFDAPFSEPVRLRMASLLTQEVMIEKEEGTSLVYYGPFSLQPVDSGKYTLNATSARRAMIHRIDSSDMGRIITVHEYNDKSTPPVAKFVSSHELNAFFNKPQGRTAIDWMSDGELVDALAKTLKNARSLNMRPETVRDIRKAIERCTMETAGIYVTDGRKARMAALLEDASAWAGKLDVIAAALAKPEALRPLLQGDAYQIVMDAVLKTDEAQEQIERVKERHNAKMDELRAEEDKLARENSLLNAQIDEKRKRIDAMKEEALSEVKEELDAARAELSAKTEELSRVNESIAALDGRVEEFVEGIGMGVDEAVRALSRNKVISMIAGTPASFAPAVAHAAAPLSPACAAAPAFVEAEAAMTPAAIVSELRNRIVEHSSRTIDEAQITNLMACLMGSSITVLSGLPGTGKTSLVGILAGAMGLTDRSRPRFSKISVERGWASHRDYIGYYNPLSGTLEASNSDVFAAMCALDEECRAAGTRNGVDDASAPYVFLLDEANLSVVENYWSPFLGNADEFLHTPASLSMQGGSSLKIPSNVRWVATVNYDHTTESLSERFLDRAWVIRMGGEALSIDDALDVPDFFDFDGVAPFSYNVLLEAFGPKAGRLLPDAAVRRSLEALFATCRQAKRPLSPRCQRSIVRYIATVEPILKEFGPAAGMKAIDLAVSQRVLPAVNGVGMGVRAFLEELKGISPALEKTNECIEHMIDAGESDGFYRFFA